MPPAPSSSSHDPTAGADTGRRAGDREGNGDRDALRGGDPDVRNATAGDAPLLITEPAPPWGPLALAVLVGLVVCTNIANVVWADWVNRRPEALLALSSRQRYLALTAAGGIGLVPYAAIGFVRLAAAFLACHFAGRAYRGHVLRLFTRFLGMTPEMVRQYELLLAKAEVVIIPLFVGSNIVAALTGVRRTPLGRLLVLLAIGLIGRLALMWWLARVFEEPLLDVLSFLQRYTVPMIIASLALVVLVNVRNFRRGAS